MSYFALPRFIVFEASLPLTENGKIKKVHGEVNLKPPEFLKDLQPSTVTAEPQPDAAQLKSKCEKLWTLPR